MEKASIHGVPIYFSYYFSNVYKYISICAKSGHNLYLRNYFHINKNTENWDLEIFIKVTKWQSPIHNSRPVKFVTQKTIFFIILFTEHTAKFVIFDILYNTFYVARNSKKVLNLSLKSIKLQKALCTPSIGFALETASVSCRLG